MDRLMNVIFPPRCYGCGVHLLAGEFSERACAACQHTCHRVEEPKCPRCAVPRDRGAPAEVCGRCLEAPPGFDEVRAVWVYDGAVSDAIRRAKAANEPESLYDLIAGSEAALGELQRGLDRHTWTTPPPHRVDLRRRGWEPARAALRRAFPTVTIGDPLTRLARTKKQAHLKRHQREGAMRDAFDCNPVRGDWVVFDDVMTTGATLNSVATALKLAGADRVVGVVLARSV